MTGLRQWSRVTRIPGVRQLKQRMWREEEYPTVTPELRTLLQDHLRSDVELLSALVDRDLGAWVGES